MQLNNHFLMNIVVNSQLDLDLVDICLGNTIQISCELLSTS